MPANPEAKRRERALRRRVRTSLAEWCRLALAAEGQEPARHHLALVSALEDVAAGSCDRLMVLMPPGSAKSTYTSVLFPPWWFTRHPASEVIAASHTAELAWHFGRRARNLLAEHGARLGLGLAVDARAAGRWEVRRHRRAGHQVGHQVGHYLAAGVDGPIIGRRADLALIDDPVKSAAEAASQGQRDAVWDWYRTDLLTRLKPGGRVVLVMTRWHEDDLGGRLLALQKDEWRCLRLPALAEADDPLGRAEGDALWPEWEDRAALNRKRETLGARAFAALFQQSPRPEEGAFFQPARLGLLAHAPDTGSGRTVRAWDLAATPKRADNNPDWTVGLKLHRDEAGRFIVLDIVRLRGSPLDVEQALLATARADGDAYQCFPQDPGQAGVFQSSHVGRLLAGFNFGFSPERGAKAARAGPVAAQMEAGNVALLRGEWNAAFIEELRGFPDGANDDQVDALSRAFARLTQRGMARTQAVQLGWMGR